MLSDSFERHDPYNEALLRQDAGTLNNPEMRGGVCGAGLQVVLVRNSPPGICVALVNLTVPVHETHKLIDLTIQLTGMVDAVLASLNDLSVPLFVIIYDRLPSQTWKP
jgi:hypothetical protein